MPGTTRYSATFDRTYEEDEGCPAEGPVTRRSRSQSWQAQTSTENGRYRPLAGLQHSRSPSVDKGQFVPKGAEVIPTRTAGKATVKAHNNPFQFVKINTAPLHQKAEQLKKLQEVKKPSVVKEDEEEWQLNLDSWKSRRRKMSETALRRQEEIKQFEAEDSHMQNGQQKKTKTFSEMVEQRATRGRALSMCLFSNPLESSEWIFEASKGRMNRVRSHDPLSGESAESSTMNSEDDNESYTKHNGENGDANNCVNNSTSHLTNGHNGIENSASNSSISKTSELSESETSQNGLSSKERHGYIDSGLESLSSSHRAGDIPDSGSDFSHDSGSSLDCDSPRVSALITTGIELLEEYSSKNDDVYNCQKEINSVKDTTVSSSASSTTSENSNKETKTKKVLKKTKSAGNSLNSKISTKNVKSVESENEMFVDDFEELERLKKSSNEPSKAMVTPNSSTFKDPLVTSSLNVIYKSSQGEKTINESKSENKTNNFSLIGEVPVDKITEEMERLILEQLEEEEKSKDLIAEDKLENFGIADDKTLDAPVKRVEPPKEKPPPPPSTLPPNAPQKENSLNRVNSTKRIIKEIHRRRSDFLGIDKPVEEINSSQLSVPPPPVLEDFLRAEREQDRLTRQMITSSLPSPSSIEEDEIAKKEREIIENLETEERLWQQEIESTEDELQKAEELRINKLKEERKQIEEEERLIAEEQKARLEEARLLQQREEYIRKQEVKNNNAPLTNVDSTLVSLKGDGESKNEKLSSPSSPMVMDAPITKENPPATPPKPLLKKKEAIRKERERLRQEQEALQREREELKVQKEQELKNSHVPRVGPPIPAKPTQLTHSSVISSSREDINGGKPNINQNMPAPTVNRQPRNAVARTKARVQQKVPCVRKQPSTEASSEIRYNQNHWLIQEAEMRRIAEQKERQRSSSTETRFIPANQVSYHQKPYPDNFSQTAPPRPKNLPFVPNYAVPAQLHSPDHQPWAYRNGNQRPTEFPSGPAKPSKGISQDQILSVSGRKRCSHCGDELGRGAAMIIESLQLYYHIQCFQCCVCQAQLGNGSCGTDVRVRNNKLHCHNCYSNDEAGLKFSQV